MLTKLILASILLAKVCLAAHVHQLSGEHGRIESPGYPSPYGNDEDTTWTITVDEGYEVELFFTVFDIEDSYDIDLGGSCVYDYVQINDGVMQKEYCGNQQLSFPGIAPRAGRKIISKGNKMIVRFVSDYSNDDPVPIGFQAFWKKVDRDECKEQRAAQFGEDWDEQLYCNHHCINIPGSFFCSCRPGFVLDENQHTCKVECSDKVLNDDSGVIQSAEYPQPYSKLADCHWTIEVREGLSVNLVFDQIFDIEDHPDEECPYDALKISYNGVERAYCGSTPPNNGDAIATNTRTVEVSFKSDLAVEGAGFRMVYYTSRIQCPDRPTAPVDGSMNSEAIEKTNFEFEDVVTFQCDPGFDLIGQDTITCLNDGSWDHTAPICQIKSCGEPGDLQTAPHTVLGDMGDVSFVFGDVVTIDCVTWYEMESGCKTWKCDENGQWSPLVNVDDGGDGIPVCTPKCGLKNGDFKEKIVVSHLANAPTADENEWPWMVFLNFGSKPNLHATDYICMGFLISPNYVATAAHCLYDEGFNVRNPANVFAHLAAHDRSRRGVTQSMNRVQQVDAAQIITHPQYVQPNLAVNTDNAKWDNDYGLIRLAEPVTMNDFIRPICLPHTDSHFDLFTAGDDGTPDGIVAGWGYKTSTGQPSFVLHDATLPSVTNADCHQAMVDLHASFNRSLDPNIRITENMFCAGFREGKSSATCQGDSGAAYMIPSPSEKYYAFGVVSFGAGLKCAMDSYTSFSKITPAASSWIVENSDLS